MQYHVLYTLTCTSTWYSWYISAFEDNTHNAGRPTDETRMELDITPGILIPTWYAMLNVYFEVLLLQVKDERRTIPVEKRLLDFITYVQRYLQQAVQISHLIELRLGPKAVANKDDDGRRHPQNDQEEYVTLVERGHYGKDLRATATAAALTLVLSPSLSCAAVSTAMPSRSRKNVQHRQNHVPVLDTCLLFLGHTGTPCLAGRPSLL